MTWQTSYYHYDGLGSTLCLTDESGDVTDQYAYTAFGEELDTGAPNPTPNPFRYVGQQGYYRDADTGDYYVRARVYRPVLARWLSEDPIGHFGPCYSYTENRPEVSHDPSGQEPVPPVSFMIRKCVPPCGPSAACFSSTDLVIKAEQLTSEMALSPDDVVRYLGGSTVLGLSAEDLIIRPRADSPAAMAGAQWVARAPSASSKGRVHHALRHCIGAGLITIRTNCKCSKCAGFWREQWVLWYAGRGLRIADAQYGEYNNRQGRLCADCTGPEADTDPTKKRSLGVPPTMTGFAGNLVPDFPSEDAIVNCCRKRLQQGALWLGPATGEPTNPTAIEDAFTLEPPPPPPEPPSRGYLIPRPSGAYKYEY